MATLTEPIKIFIVQSLACMFTPQQVADAVKQEFDLIIDRRQCAAYDPNKLAGKNLSQELKDLFYSTRVDYKLKIQDIPVANQAYRLRELQDMYDNAGNNSVIKQAILKQAFLETDGRATKHDITTNGESLNNAKPTVIELVAPNVNSTDRTTA